MASTSWNELKGPLLARWKAWWLERHPEEIGEYSWSYLFEQGKQIRPQLFCELWTYLCPEHPPSAELAFMIECIHAASLILDDLPWMDNAHERRGLRTLHRVFTIRKALLLVVDVLELAGTVVRSLGSCDHENGKATSLSEWIQFTRTSEWSQWIRSKVDALWRGQWLDLSRTGSLEELAALKTGILFEWTAELVARGTGHDPNFWRGWGQAIGILFQWMDDWNDREEDLVIQQRNAFNEAYEKTQIRYGELWTTVVETIGLEWWKRPFGAFMYEYFTRIEIASPPSSISSISSISSLSTRFTPIMYDPTAPLPSCPLTPTLTFMCLIRPYVYDTYSITWDTAFLWSIPEERWIQELEKKEGIRPYVPLFRHCERMIIDQDEEEDTGDHL